MQPANARIAKARASRVKDSKVPAIVQVIAHISDDVPRAVVLGRKQIAGPDVVTARGKSATDRSGSLTAHKNAHLRSFKRGSGPVSGLRQEVWQRDPRDGRSWRRHTPVARCGENNRTSQLPEPHLIRTECRRWTRQTTQLLPRRWSSRQRPRKHGAWPRARIRLLTGPSRRPSRRSRTSGRPSC